MNTKEVYKRPKTSLLLVLLDNADKILPLVKEPLTYILNQRGKKWVDNVDPIIKNKTIEILELVKKIKPNKIKFIDDLILSLSNHKFVYDENNNWSYINKLNTNKRDFPILLSDILYDCKTFDVNKIYKEIRDDKRTIDLVEFAKFLNELPKHSNFIWDRYLTNVDRYIENIKKSSKDGDLIEKNVLNYYKQNGWELIHQGGNGDLIDMLLGVDLIIKKENDYLFLQVKKVSSISDVEIEGKKYVQVKGSHIMPNMSFADLLIFGTLDGNVFEAKKQEYFIINNGELISHFGIPLPIKSNGYKILVKK